MVNSVETKLMTNIIVNTISDGLIVTDKEKRIVLVNKAAERIFKIKQEEIIGEKFLDIINSEEIYNLIDKASKTDLDKDLSYREYNDIELGWEKEPKHYRVESRTVRNNQDESIGEVTLIQDITKLKQLNEMKSQFILTAAHELRTPLTSIGMGVGLLLEKVDTFSEDQKELISAIKEDQERLTVLVNDLLDLSRMEANKSTMNIEKADVNEIIEKNIASVKSQIEKAEATVNLNLNKDIPAVAADCNKISSVITNIISNALRYIPDDGSGTIDISTNLSEDLVLVSISDNGSGIPEEFQDKIFDKFVQVKSDVSKAGSSGLGLAISKEIIDAHGGKIWVKSELNHGSTFYFTLRKYSEAK